MNFSSFLKASRADFLPASLVPFFTGAAYAFSEGFFTGYLRLVLGGAGVASLHLFGNLVNDYYDYKSGNDGPSEKISSFFGGSRAVERGLCTEKEIMKFAFLCLAAAVFCAAGIFLITKNLVFPAVAAGAALLAAGYTAPPVKLSYRRAGEAVIFVLFGVLLVTGGFYLFSERITAGSFLMSLPISFLILAVILCNEIPDYRPDSVSGKRNLHSFLGPEKGYILYGAAAALSYAAVLLNIAAGILPSSAVFLVVLYIPGARALINLKTKFNHTASLIESCRLSVLQHSIAGGAVCLLLIL